MAAPVDFCAAAMHCGNVDGTGSRASSETGAAAGADEDRAARRDELAIAGDRAARRRAGLRALGRMNAMAVPQNWRRIADLMVVAGTGAGAAGGGGLSAHFSSSKRLSPFLGRLLRC